MDAQREFRFLAELRDTAGGALKYAERMREIASSWAEADDTVYRVALKRYRTAEARRSRRTDSEASEAALVEKGILQAEFFLSSTLAN